MKIKKIGPAIALSVIAGISVVSFTGCGAASDQHTNPVTDSKAQNVQQVEYEGMASNASVIIFDVMRPDGTVLTCSTKKDVYAGASCFEKKG